MSVEKDWQEKDKLLQQQHIIRHGTSCSSTGWWSPSAAGIAHQTDGGGRKPSFTLSQQPLDFRAGGGV